MTQNKQSLSAVGLLCNLWPGTETGFCPIKANINFSTLFVFTYPIFQLVCLLCVCVCVCVSMYLCNEPLSFVIESVYSLWCLAISRSGKTGACMQSPNALICASFWAYGLQIHLYLYLVRVSGHVFLCMQARSSALDGWACFHFFLFVLFWFFFIPWVCVNAPMQPMEHCD